MSQGAVVKTCVLCGQNCAGKKRIKDARGRYYCQECHEAALRKRAARADSSLHGPAMSSLELALQEAVPPETAAAPPTSPAPAGPVTACPGCAAPMAAGADVCIRCGYSRSRGRRLEVNTGAAREGGGALAGGAAAVLLSPMSVGVAAIALVGLLFGLATTSVEVTVAYMGIVGLFGLVLGVTVLVLAFVEGIGQGLLTLCVPFYAIYFVYAVCESSYVKWLFGASMLGHLGAIYLQATHLDALAQLGV